MFACWSCRLCSAEYMCVVQKPAQHPSSSAILSGPANCYFWLQAIEPASMCVCTAFQRLSRLHNRSCMHNARAMHAHLVRSACINQSRCDAQGLLQALKHIWAGPETRQAKLWKRADGKGQRAKGKEQRAEGRQSPARLTVIGRQGVVQVFIIWLWCEIVHRQAPEEGPSSSHVSILCKQA